MFFFRPFQIHKKSPRRGGRRQGFRGLATLNRLVFMVLNRFQVPFEFMSNGREQQ